MRVACSRETRAHAFRRMPPAKRKMMRAEHVRPLMPSFFESVEEARAATHRRDLATKAFGYAFKRRQQLLRVLGDGRLPLDNTRSERSLRKMSSAAKRMPRAPQPSSPSSPRAAYTPSTQSSIWTKSCGCCRTGRRNASSSLFPKMESDARQAPT